MPTFNIGADGSFWIGTAAAPTVVGDVSTDTKTVKINHTVGEADVTTLQPTDYAQVWIPALTNATIDFDKLIDSPAGNNAIEFSACLNGRETLNFELYPFGKVTGNLRIRGAFFYTGGGPQTEVVQAVQNPCKGRISGAVVYDAAP